MQKELIESNPLLKHSIEFALLIINFCDKLNEEGKFIIANQLLKSGTAIGANAMDAQNVETRADFIHKLKIAAKDATETNYWLVLCNYSNENYNIDNLTHKLTEIQKILNSILKTAKAN